MSYTDMIDPATVRLVNTFGDMLSWPVTLGIMGIELQPGRGVVVHAEDTARWPDYHLDNNPAGGLARFTLCAGFQVNGQWVMSGFFEYWAHGTHENHLRTDSGAHPLEIDPGKGINQWQANWVYNNGWAPLNGVVPQPGHLMALMVVAGDARMSKTRTVAERSQIVTVPLQLSGSWGFNANAPEQPPAPPDPPPHTEPPVPDPTIPTDVLSLLKTTRDEIILTKLALEATTNEFRAALKDLSDKLDRAPAAQKAPVYVGTAKGQYYGSASITLTPKE